MFEVRVLKKHDHGQHLKDKTAISYHGCNYKSCMMWMIDCCDTQSEDVCNPTMIWTTLNDQTHPTTHVIVVTISI